MMLPYLRCLPEQFRSNVNREAILDDRKNCSVVKCWSISNLEMLDAIEYRVDTGHFMHGVLH